MLSPRQTVAPLRPAPSGRVPRMSRGPLALLSFTLAASLGYFTACTEESLGTPCETNADCEEGMICDVHDGQGTCQHDHDHTGDDTEGDTEASGCASETRDDDFAVGLSKSGTMITATFVSAEPNPPALGDNGWVMTFTAIDGTTLDSPQITVTPTMPDHGHGTPIEAVVTATENANEYSVTPVNLFMAGLWEVAFDVSVGEDQDTVTFAFCVE